ncbi:hypothetical protein E1A91_D01G085700v1 [Gossypium mustelinum]|uniref:F-box domain-containing protein n=3 Tax=Gossypium TaxID=3633 RepID=A0A5J5SLM8_GOSBA|nr:hypothetical protein ES319_D01G080200v1 [Gossypium barbadense]TYG82451.1 hypothetical protein ES288_D01G089300v1 [Gossypium darwinii]TYI96616.1 hypothetical protein E1A91_D01G085700v1 [Gossypium mustelinum]
MGKEVNRKKADRISDLPDSILTHILSFLSTNEAVRTSILPTRWRYLFALLPNLHFDLEDVLRRKNFNIHRGVKHLDLNIYLDKFITLPDVLFTCRTLVSLKVDKDFVLDVPRGVVHLPNLNTLHLESVKFLNDDSIKNLLSGCSNLEDMVLKQCYMENISKFNISHQLLKRLTIDYLYSIENLQSLVKADIYLFKTNYTRQGGATTLFRGICNVPSLILWVTSLELLLSCKPLPVFATFFKLKIPCYDLCREYSYIRGGKGLETLLSSLPALEKLEFSQEVLCFLPENVPSCLLYKLKAIKITNFTDEKHCIGKAKYFLKNGGALQKLTILTAPDVSVEKQLKISNVLLASPRESKQLCILIV